MNEIQIFAFFRSYLENLSRVALRAGDVNLAPYAGYVFITFVVVVIKCSVYQYSVSTSSQRIGFNILDISIANRLLQDQRIFAKALLVKRYCN